MGQTCHLIFESSTRTSLSDRYHLDERFDPEKASERYARWVNNSYNDGEDVLYLDYKGTAAGFSIVDISRDKAYLGLIGLGKKYKGKGLGISLFSATCQYIKDKGVKEISTTASLNNISALNMYAICGFKFRDPVYVLHNWL
jgi:GNAT superfamily N-acetyltransferase